MARMIPFIDASTICNSGEKAHLSSETIAKLGKDENVTTDVHVKICKALNCDIADIVEIADLKNEV